MYNLCCVLRMCTFWSISGVVLHRTNEWVCSLYTERCRYYPKRLEPNGITLTDDGLPIPAEGEDI